MCCLFIVSVREAFYNLFKTVLSVNFASGPFSLTTCRPPSKRAFSFFFVQKVAHCSETNEKPIFIFYILFTIFKCFQLTKIFYFCASQKRHNVLIRIFISLNFFCANLSFGDIVDFVSNSG